MSSLLFSTNEFYTALANKSLMILKGCDTAQRLVFMSQKPSFWLLYTQWFLKCFWSNHSFPEELEAMHSFWLLYTHCFLKCFWCNHSFPEELEDICFYSHVSNHFVFFQELLHICNIHNYIISMIKCVTYWRGVNDTFFVFSALGMGLSPRNLGPARSLLVTRS